MGRWLLVSLAIVGVLVCPHICAARTVAALALQLDRAACTCCDTVDRDCTPAEHSAPAEQDCRDCVCDGVTVAVPTDYSPDFSLSYASIAPDQLLVCGSGNGSTGFGQTQRTAVVDEASVGRCMRLAIHSLLL